MFFSLWLADIKIGGIKNKIIISLGTQYKEKNLSMNKHKIQIFFKDKKNNIIKKNNNKVLA